jgi:hypothetical protein
MGHTDDNTSDGNGKSPSYSELKVGGSSPETSNGSEEGSGNYGDVDSDNADESSSGSDDNEKAGPLSGGDMSS